MSDAGKAILVGILIGSIVFFIVNLYTNAVGLEALATSDDSILLSIILVVASGSLAVGLYNLYQTNKCVCKTE